MIVKRFIKICSYYNMHKFYKHRNDNMSGKIALVTGANKGIGLSIARELCKRGVGAVYIGSRDIKRGQEAVDKLKKEGLKAETIQLEVTDVNSVKAAAKQLKVKHGGLDILINNAGVISPNLYNATYEDAKHVINVNYKSILILQDHLYPILKENARVINISSDCGHIANIRNPQWIQRLTSKDLKLEDINAFVEWYLNSVKTGTLKEEDFAETPMLDYRVSKIALTALTRLQQKLIGKNISVNALHPGFVQTDMTKGVGMLTMEESGKAPAYLALDAPQSLKGKYLWWDKKERDWENHTLDLYCHFKVFEKHLKDAGKF